MKIQDLQQPYRALAEMRREHDANTPKGYYLSTAFEWTNTKEGDVFWREIWYNKYPEIPAASLEELKEWQNPEYEATVIAEQPKEEPDPRLFQAALAAMQGIISSVDYHGTNEALANEAWDYAEALIKEGKKRGKLD